MVLFARAEGEGWVFDAVSITGEPYIPAATYGCTPSDAYIAAMSMRADAGVMVNVLAAARRGGTQATVTDADSLALYGRHSHVQNDLELATDGDRDLWQSFYLTRQAKPARGVGGITMRPDAAALAQMLGFGMGTIVRIFDEHHGADIDRPARWIGARYSADATGVQVDAITGEDASIRAVDRRRFIDTPGEWASIWRTGINDNLSEPGIRVLHLPPYRSTPALRELVEDALDDASLPTPQPTPPAKPKRTRKRKPDA